jgi:hypothetical protein
MCVHLIFTRLKISSRVAVIFRLTDVARNGAMNIDNSETNYGKENLSQWSLFHNKSHTHRADRELWFLSWETDG